MRLFDGHNHLQYIDSDDAEEVSNALILEGVSPGMLALGTLDENELTMAIGLQNSSTYPIFSLVNPPRIEDAEGNLVFLETALQFVGEFLDAGVRGIGELILRHSGSSALRTNIPADDEMVISFYRRAALRGLPVSLHFEIRQKADPITDVESRVQELRKAVSSNPDTIFIWSPLGDSGPAAVRALVEGYPNLYADLSVRNPYLARGWPMGLQSLGAGSDGQGRLKTGWKDVFEDYPDRFLFDLDLSSQDRQELLEPVIVYSGSVLGHLSQETAEKIACKKARSILLALTVSATGSRQIRWLSATTVLGIVWRRRRVQ